MSQSNFIINLAVGKFQGSSMSLKVTANNLEIYNNPDPKEDHIKLDFNCNLPVQIKFIVDNKQNFDTQVDEQGNIVEDKYIQVQQLIIDRMPVDPWILESRLFHFSTGQTTNYFGTNGVATLDILDLDSFGFFLDLMSRD